MWKPGHSLDQEPNQANLKQYADRFNIKNYNVLPPESLLARYDRFLHAHRLHSS